MSGGEQLPKVLKAYGALPGADRVVEPPVPDGWQPKLVATDLDGTLCAIARTIACLLEVHQRADGSVHVPKALRPWLGGVEELTPGMNLATAVPTA